MIQDSQYYELVDFTNKLKNSIFELQNKIDLLNTNMSAPATSFFVKITGHTAISGASNRWAYSYAIVNYDIANNAFVATSYTGTCYNLCEVMNSASGLQGNGVNIANLTGTFAIIPVPTNSICKMDCYGGQNWIEVSNAVDGGC